MPSLRDLPSAAGFAEDGLDGRVEVDHASLLFDGDQERIALLPPVVHDDVDSRVVLLEPGGTPSPAAPRVLGTRDEGDHLAATAEQSAQHVARHLAQVRTHDDEVASDRTQQSPARTGRPS